MRWGFASQNEKRLVAMLVFQWCPHLNPSAREGELVFHSRLESRAYGGSPGRGGSAWRTRTSKLPHSPAVRAPGEAPTPLACTP
jgi:hypothetical protein